MARLIILLALIFGLLLFLNWFRKTPPQQVVKVVRKALLWGAAGLLLLAVLTGRLSVLFAAIAAAIPLVMRLIALLSMLPMIQQVLRSLGLGGLVSPSTTAGAPGGSGRHSSIRTRYLEVTLDHDSGHMDGKVREGPFADQTLSQLALDQLLRMLELYQDADAQSASILTAYLDREHGEDWRDAAQARADPGSGAHSGAHSGSGNTGSGNTGLTRGMTKDDAWAVLGLTPGSDAEAIRAAHRRLMLKLHPDRGGSDYLAAQINTAKALLLGE
ncbi:MAG TPA: molecular chaperone DnaJ [Chromatiaceae bacterium]|jgi:hypothetical protein|nr:MAG: hypothetical protein N838_10520 [Thiohalocapsa sp. PB-PSB1]QQO54206.1 MAG: DnaJ domain-containing protein [Thiohalocapsa sp. PB-PSB1]HBG97051.1 molecular chaperone DnaJ [Chromatiaceae bacterium]HCS91624.1 molecular chaperone DnaJ [Chromatiaceae bacterium]